MPRGGVILAQDINEGKSLQQGLGLHDWIIVTPRNYKSAGRGFYIEPRVLTTLREPGEIIGHLMPSFRMREPDVYFTYRMKFFD